MVSIATLFVYFNPKLLNVSPQRHFRSSRVEVINNYYIYLIINFIVINIYNIYCLIINNNILGLCGFALFGILDFFIN